MSLQIVILAAGQGKRMVSDLPKVLHPIAGKPMLERVIETAKALNPDQITVIIGHGGEQVRAALGHLPVQWVEQKTQLGTGHALMQALPHLPAQSKVLVLSGDVPLISLDTLQQLVQAATTPLTLLVAQFTNPHGLGRILRDEAGAIRAIVEEKDASPAQRAIQEIYSGICCADYDKLQDWLPRLANNNAQGEYYLTDIIRLAVDEGIKVNSVTTDDELEIQGVNNRLQQQTLERACQRRQAEALMMQGVMLADADRIDIRGELICGRDVFIDLNTVFIGRVVLGDGCHIGPHSVLQATELGAHTVVHSHSVLDGAKVGPFGEIGPFARLRPGTELADHCKIGNFVETKNTQFDSGSKANHLTYLGDARIGKKVNVGAGTITCNYDGANKHLTCIEDGAFIGSGTQLVAPVTVGANATLGAGTTLRKDAPAGELTLTESRQKTITGWKRPVKTI